MPEPTDLATKFRAAISEAAFRLRILRPFRDLEGYPLGEKGDRVDSLLAEASGILETLLSLRRDSPGLMASKGIQDELLARMTFNLSDCLGRTGFVERAEGFLDLAEGILKGGETLRAKALGRLNLIILRLGHAKYPEALELYKSLFALGDEPLVWRCLAGAAFYLSFASLRENSPVTAEALYASFIENREHFMPCLVPRPQECPLGEKLQAAGNQDPIIPPGKPLAMEDFPLGITIMGRRFLERFHMQGLKAPLHHETADNLVARIGTMLTVWHGEHRSIEEALRRFETLDLWGDGPGPLLEKAHSATFLTFYLGPDYRASARIFEKVFGNLGKDGGDGTLDPEIAVERAKCLINLVFACGASGDTGLAAHYFGMLTRSSVSREDPLLYSKAALNLITALASKGQVSEARKVYDQVLEWGSGWEERIVRLKAVRCLIHYYGQAGKVSEAKALFATMDGWEGGGDLFLLRSQAAVFLMEVLEAHGDLQGAKELYATLRWKKGSLEEDLNRITAARTLAMLGASKGDYHGAMEAYRSLQPWGDNGKLDQERARLAVNLILAFGKAGMPKQARYVHSTMDHFATGKDTPLLKAKATVNLIAACEAAGDPRRAQALYDGLEYREDKLPFAREKAKAAVTLIGLYGRMGQPHKGRAVYLAMPDFRDPEYRVLKNSAGVNLVTAFAMADRWAEALDSATEVVSEGMPDQQREELLKKLNFIISKTAEYGKRDQLNILGIFSDN
ncbi:MAG: hypothetical protein LBF40_01020 [Deltaproteobacteria bacterium]|jgi:tetratricopeptide (TPR) repeat protein|nr:hypothetical protein [Deltaproteobacteria bacterium]